jgi:hypothetical protein
MLMPTPGIVFAGLILLGQVPGAAGGATARRVDLGPAGATLFIPPGYHPAAGVVDLVLHLHGAGSIVEAALVESGLGSALIEFNRNGLSRVYAEPFADRTLFPRLIDAALAALRGPEDPAAAAPRLGKLTVSSFSAGFGGVRELLKVPEHFARIDTLVMADSIYAGYAGDLALRRVDPDLMDGFRRFALEAVRGRKTFVVTHSAQVPEGYGSTTETADFLIEAVAPGQVPAATATRVVRADGWIQTRRFARGRFLVLGFAGGEGTDHMQHLREIARTWKTIASDPTGPFDEMK